MNTCYDVAVIGAGVVGASIARELSRFRLNILLLEKEAEVAFGVSKSNSGIIHPGTQINPLLLKARLCVEGNRLIRRLSRELSVDFKETGELIVAFTDEERGRLAALKSDAERCRVRGLRIVEGAWLKTHEPNLNPEALCALFAPSAGIISPYRLVYALCENASKNGVEILSACRLERIVGGSPFELVTTRGIFRARRLVNAAGLFADEVAAMAGCGDFKIRPRRGEEFLLDKKKAYLTRHLLFPLPSKMSKGILVTRTADGNPMIGPTADDTEDKMDLSTTEEGLHQALVGARRLVPAVEAKDIIAYFAGLRPVAGDDFIIRRAEKAPGFINVAGIQSPGLTAAPAIACTVRELLRQDGMTLARKILFKCHRPKSVHLLSLSWSERLRAIRKNKDYGDMVCRCEMVSSGEVKDAVRAGAVTMDGIKFRTRAQAGRCHGNFCTSRIMKILSTETRVPLAAVTKRGPGSEIVKADRTG